MVAEDVPNSGGRKAAELGRDGIEPQANRVWIFVVGYLQHEQRLHRLGCYLTRKLRLLGEVRVPPLQGLLQLACGAGG